MFNRRIRLILLVIGYSHFLFSGSVLAGNGSNRGGGDEIVANFRDVERSIYAELRSWTDIEIPTPITLSDLNVYRLDSEPTKDILSGITVKKSGFFVEPTRRTIYFTRDSWERKKAELRRFELETFVFELTLDARKIPSPALVALYAIRSARFADWKDRKAEAVNYALVLYRQASDGLRSNAFVALQVQKILMPVHPDYEPCFNPDVKNSKRPSERENHCRAWLTHFVEKLKNIQSVQKNQVSHQTVRMPETLKNVWIADKLSIYSEEVADVAKVNAEATTLALLDGFDQTSATIESDVSRAARFYERYVNTSIGARENLENASQRLDDSFEAFSDALAEQITEPK